LPFEEWPLLLGSAGGAAGALTKPLLDNLTLPLIVVGVALALVYFPKPGGR